MLTTLHQRYRRHKAALRMPPLECGHRDPLLEHLKEPMPPTPSTVLTLIAMNATVNRAQAVDAWHTYPAHRPMIENYVASRRQGWEVAA